MTGERRGETCPYDELAVGWAMHALEPNEEAQLRDHLPGCGRCQHTVRSTHEVMAVMGGSVRQEEPPPRLRARLMDAIEHTPQEPLEPAGPKHALPEPAPLRPRRGRVLLAAAALLAVVGLGAVAGLKLNQVSGDLTAERARSTQLADVIALMNNPDTAKAELLDPTGKLAAVVLSTDNRAAVVPQAMPSNDSSHIYVVWGTSTPDPVALATFDVKPGSPDPSVLTWTPDAHKHKGFAVSLEPGRVAPAKPSTVVASGQVA